MRSYLAKAGIATSYRLPPAAVWHDCNSSVVNSPCFSRAIAITCTARECGHQSNISCIRSNCVYQPRCECGWGSPQTNGWPYLGENATSMPSQCGSSLPGTDHAMIKWLSCASCSYAGSIRAGILAVRTQLIAMHIADNAGCVLVSGGNPGPRWNPSRRRVAATAGHARAGAYIQRLLTSLQALLVSLTHASPMRPQFCNAACCYVRVARLVDM